MARVTRQVQASATVSVCDFCGLDEVIVLQLDGCKFDPTSRSSGFGELALWPSHPYDGKNACANCVATKKTIHREIAPAPEGMARARIYPIERCHNCDGKGCVLVGCQDGFCYGGDGRGLRLPEAPSTKAMHYALVTSNDKKRGLFFVERDAHWVPSVATSEVKYMMSAASEGVILLAENTSATPWRTVWHARKLADDRARTSDEVANRYGGEAARRAQREGGGICELLEVSLRVPMEILW